MILVKPTVADVIALLQKLPPEMSFVMEDADTNWTINTIHVSVFDNEVCFFGTYDEMLSRRDAVSETK